MEIKRMLIKKSDGSILAGALAVICALSVLIAATGSAIGAWSKKVRAERARFYGTVVLEANTGGADAYD